MPAMTMVQALNSAMDVMLARDPDVVMFGEDVGFYGGVFRVTEGLQQKHGEHARVRHADRRGRHDGGRGRHGRLRPRPVVEIQFADYIYPGDRPAGLRGGAAALPLGRRVLGADHGARAVRRRHLRRPDAQPERRGDLHPCLRPEDRHPVQPLRRQGAADQRRSRTTTRSSSSSRSGSITARSTAIPTGRRRPWAAAPAEPRCRTGYYTVPLGKAAVVREGAAVTVLVYGTMVHVALAAAEETGIDAEIIDLRTLAAARHRHDRRLGEEDRPLRRSRTRRPAPAASAPSWRRWCRSIASIIWRRRSCASPAGTRPIRTPSNGNISPGPARLADGMRRALEG